MSFKRTMNDTRHMLNQIRKSDDLIYRLERPSRELERTQRLNGKLLKTAEKLQRLEQNPDPNFLHHVWLHWRLNRIEKQLRGPSKLAEALRGMGHSIKSEAKYVLYQTGFALVFITVYVLSWAFLLFVLLPILWDWFWQLPPGLK